MLLKPSSKKRKRSSEEAASFKPIIFVSPGNKSDVCLKVFKQKFYVHSHILKERSNYFRRFLDSPDKEDAPVANLSLFRYNYSTVVDDDGIWGLESAAKAAPLTEEMISRIDNLDQEIESFRCLLCAMYNRPYTVNSVEELELLTKHADFYCALPIVSATLTNALLRSSIFEVDSDISCDIYAIDAARLMLVAFQLRHSALFREFLIHTVANWAANSDGSPYNFSPISRLQELKSLVELKNLQLCEKVMKVSHRLLFNMTGNLKSHPVSEAIQEAREAVMDYVDETSAAPEFAKFYRHLLEFCKRYNNWHFEEFTELEEVLTSLLKNNLVFDRSGARPGEGLYTYCFLCTEIADEEMPWDTTAVDW